MPIEVTIQELISVTDQAEKQDPFRHDIMLSDLISIADRVLTPARPTISNVSPPAGRHPETLTITGTGFNPSPARNSVQMVGFNCPIISATETELVVTTPFILLFVQGHVNVEVRVPDSAEERNFAAWPWYVRNTTDDVADRAGEDQVPGPREDFETEAPSYAEAKDWQRLLTITDNVLGHDSSPGSMLVSGPNGLTQLEPDPGFIDFGTDGLTPVADPSSPNGISFGFGQPHDMPFGGAIAPSGVSILNAGGSQGDAPSVSVSGGTPSRGMLDLIHFLIVRPAGTDTIDRIVVKVDGLIGYDSGPGLGLANLAVFSREISVKVEKASEVTVEATKLGATGTISMVGGVRMALA